MSDCICSDKLIKIINIQTEVVYNAKDLPMIMDIVTKGSMDITGCDGASIELVENDQLVYSSVSGIASDFIGLRIMIENSLSGTCMNLKKALVSDDIETDDRVNKVASRQIGLRSMVVVPLLYGDKVVGILKVLSKTPGFFKEEDIKILELMSGLIAAAMYNAMANSESELIYQATHDNLTGLSNRAFFYDKLRKILKNALKLNMNFAIISIDMDGLKETNDFMGHRAGDAALVEIANRIGILLGDKEIFSRLGGDEFGIIMKDISGREEVVNLIEQINASLSDELIFEDKKIDIGCSIGYAMFSEDGIDLDVLIEKADKSMYKIKKIRKGEGKVRNKF